MDWLPAPDDFKAELTATVKGDEASVKLEHLVKLASCRLNYVETIQVDNLLRRLSDVSSQNLPVIRLALLASCTVDHLLPAIRVAALRYGLHAEIYCGQYGQYRQEVLDPGSPLYQFGPDVVLFSLTAHDFIAGIPVAGSIEEVDTRITESIAGLVELWRQTRDGLAAEIIQQSFLSVSDPLFGNHDRLIPGAPRRLVEQLNHQLIGAAISEETLILDLVAAQASDGLDAWFDVTRWLQGKIEIAPQAAPKYGELLARLLAARAGKSKKCLVLDLDNTLWGGVVGDDGIEGLILGEGNAVGEAHLAIQRYAKALNERGVILAVCSKNEMDIAEGVFRDHPEMILKRTDLAAFVANWSDKAVNLRSIAEQLNIGLDSLVFVDDNPVERARVREALPMVAVPELPPDVAGYVRRIADAGYFESVSFTEDDRQRAEQYLANAKRQTAQTTAQSMDDFLQSLEMVVEFGPVGSVDLARVTQLLNKTNQFNTTTTRYAGDEISRLASDPRNLLLWFRLADRFGDNGLVSVMVICPYAGNSEKFEIQNWVMSCRVFGRQLEEEAMNIAVEMLLERKVSELRATYRPTDRNGVISQLYESLGFVELADAPKVDKSTHWGLELRRYTPRQTFLRRGGMTNDE